MRWILPLAMVAALQPGCMTLAARNQYWQPTPPTSRSTLLAAAAIETGIGMVAGGVALAASDSPEARELPFYMAMGVVVTASVDAWIGLGTIISGAVANSP